MNLKKASPIEIADDIVVNMPPMLSYNDSLYLYNGKYYEIVKKRTIGHHIYNYFHKHDPEAFTPNKLSSINETIHYNPRIKEVSDLDAYNNYINLNNGVLNLDTYELLPHSPDFFFTGITRVDYDPNNRNTPVFDAFINSVFTEDDGTPDYHTIDNMLQLGGYILYPQNKMEMMFIFYGTGSNGKSVLIKSVFQRFFDKKFLSSLSLNALSKEESFARKALLTSVLNISTEQKAGDIESEELKKISSGEMININRKNEDTVDFEPKCKLIVAGNRFMRFKDTTEGTRRRLMIFNFKNNFETNVEKYKKIRNPKQKRIFLAQNKDMLNNSLEKELPGILNLFLDGLKRLRDNSWKFNLSKNNVDVFNEYIAESDWLGSWLEDNWEESKDDYISIKDLVNQYRFWFIDNFPDKKFDISTKLMGRRIKDLFRIEPQKVNSISGGSKTSFMAYYIKRKEDNDDIWKILNQEQQNTLSSAEKTQESML